jgi:hypothetical protein
MTRERTPTEKLALEVLQKARELSANIEPLKVLKARAYRVLNSNILIRAASIGKTGRYFFGLNYINAEEVANLDNPYFIFACGSPENVVIIPGPILIAHLPNISHDRNGEFKLNFDEDYNLVLSGRNNRLDCSGYLNAWHQLSAPAKFHREITTAEESFHSVLQGRLLEIGRIREFQTFCPNKSKRFNGTPLSDLSTLRNCPNLQFSDYEILRQIDVLWFREKGSNQIPECAFEIELSTGTWSGVGRLATLIDYMHTHLYIISDESKRYEQVMRAYAEMQSRYKRVPIQLVGELYTAELNLTRLRQDIGI